MKCCSGQILVKWMLLYTHTYIYEGRVAQSVLRLGYGLNGAGSYPGGYELFRPFIITLRPNQPPMQLVSELCLV